MLTIHEYLTEDGSSETVALDVDGGALVVHVGKEPPVTLPILALARVMDRYGKPLAEGIAIDGPKLDVDEGRALYRIRHRARYDVIARDFLVWTAHDREPVAELAVAVCGALVHLAKVAADSPVTEPSGG
jgi:hypothetical protein